MAYCELDADGLKHSQYYGIVETNWRGDEGSYPCLKRAEVPYPSHCCISKNAPAFPAFQGAGQCESGEHRSRSDNFHPTVRFLAL